MPYGPGRGRAHHVPMFAAAELLVDVPFTLAHARLRELLARDGLGRASDGAYEAGLAEFSSKGGAEEAISGWSRPVRVQALPPRSTADGTRVPLRWVATGVSGHLFPALDADLILSSDGVGSSRLLINACYQPSFQAVGEGDRLRLREIAELTMGELLSRLASMLTEPDGVGGSEA